MIPKAVQLSYKKVIGFTEDQRKSLLILESYNVNVNKFIRSAIKEKYTRELPEITKPKSLIPF